MSNDPSEEETPVAKLRLTRRQWLRRVVGGGLVAGVGMAGYAIGVEPHWLEFVERDLPIEALGTDLEGKRLIQISDLHVGPIVDESYVISAFKTVAQLEPDLLVLTGDFVTSNADGTPPLEMARRVYSELKPARLATLGILGNHDYGPQWTSDASAMAVASVLRDCGCLMLRNAATTVAGLRIVGFEDYWGPSFDRKLMTNLPASEEPTLVLCHNPDVVDLPIWSNYRGWILSGHTHGGQCKAPFLSPPRIPVKNKRYTSGAFDLSDGRQLYINRGLGYSIRVRFNVRPEITVFTLRRA